MAVFALLLLSHSRFGLALRTLPAASARLLGNADLIKNTAHFYCLHKIILKGRVPCIPPVKCELWRHQQAACA